MSNLNVGSTVWVFDENRRVYPPTPKGKLWAPSGPIYREHFRPLKIASETPRYWVLSNGLKVNKKTLDGIYTDEKQIDAMSQCILVDIDGTIALRGDRDPHDHDTSMEDAPNWHIIRLIDCLDIASCKVILISGRDEQYRDVTEYWLATHNILTHRHSLIMRPRGDNRPDEVVKEELYRQHIEPHFTVLYVFDDRNKVVAMWRRIGLTCLQVADGDF